MTIGTVTDYLGRRKVMIFAVTVFSIFTVAVAFSNSIFAFGLYRFLAGLGLGGCLPTAITLVTEFARNPPPKHTWDEFNQQELEPYPRRFRNSATSL